LILFIFGVLKSIAKPMTTRASSIVVTDRPIPAGCLITYECVHDRDIAPQYISKNMMTACDLVAGRCARNFIPAGDPIRESDLLPNGQTLAQQLSSGLRAVGFNLTPEGLANYSVHPRDRVDVIVTANKDGKAYTSTICQDILVLSATPREALLSDKPNQADANRVTLAVTQQQAEILSQAAETGKIRLAVRNPEDHKAGDAAGADERDIFPADLFVQKTVAATLVPAAPPVATAPPLVAMNMSAPASDVKLPQASALPPIHGWIVELFKGAVREEREFAH
jgi:Flp pilus assembly protein CpaB